MIVSIWKYESVVASGCEVMVSLYMYSVFVEGDLARNKVDGLVDCKKIQRYC